MKNFDIESYLDGELSDEEKNAFENQMKINPEFSHEVEKMEMLTGDLKMQMLREQVGNALCEENNDTKKNNYKWLGLFLGIALSLAVVFIFSQKDEEIPIVEKTEEKVEWPHAPSTDKLPINKNESALEKKEIKAQEKKSVQKINADKKTKKAPQPIAENKSTQNLSPPIYPSPDLGNVRGSSDDNTELKSILDQIWYVDFPPKETVFNPPFDKAGKLLAERDFTKAYVRLQLLERKYPANDTLNFMKGYCLLEMGQGEEAGRYLDKTKNLQNNWAEHIEWYQGLSLLLTGNQNDGLAKFKNISANKNHSFSAKAKKTTELLK